MIYKFNLDTELYRHYHAKPDETQILFSTEYPIGRWTNIKWDVYYIEEIVLIIHDADTEVM